MLNKRHQHPPVSSEVSRLRHHPQVEPIERRMDEREETYTLTPSLYAPWGPFPIASHSPPRPAPIFASTSWPQPSLVPAPAFPLVSHSVYRIAPKNKESAIRLARPLHPPPPPVSPHTRPQRSKRWQRARTATIPLPATRLVLGLGHERQDWVMRCAAVLVLEVKARQGGGRGDPVRGGWRWVTSSVGDRHRMGRGTRDVTTRRGLDARRPTSAGMSFSRGPHSSPARIRQIVVVIAPSSPPSIPFASTPKSSAYDPEPTSQGRPPQENQVEVGYAPRFNGGRCMHGAPAEERGAERRGAGDDDQSVGTGVSDRRRAGETGPRTSTVGVAARRTPASRPSAPRDVAPPEGHPSTCRPSLVNIPAPSQIHTPHLTPNGPSSRQSECRRAHSPSVPIVAARPIPSLPPLSTPTLRLSRGPHPFPLIPFSPRSPHPHRADHDVMP
ncbi:hypothetical protein B0H14DRAFT_3177877 [Mycena olivaceomarginata]|nr:hypothetical protein B0H14DRAFT_3177877 [Mycena olivaceomarginata]